MAGNKKSTKLDAHFCHDLSPVSSKVSTEESDIVPDGGYGWLIVFTSFMLHFIGDGMSYIFGIFLVAINDEYPTALKSETAWIVSIKIAVTFAVGPIGSMLVNKFGCRVVSIAGSVLAAVGFAVSYFTPNVATMYATIGILAGIGLGLLYLPAMISVPQYFNKRRSLAMGIATAGTGLGTYFFEWVLGIVLLYYSWRVTLLIAGGIILLSTVFAFLYKPQKKDEKIQDNNGNTTCHKIPQPEGYSNNGSKSCCQSFHDLIDLSLLKNPLFLIFALSNILTSIGYNVPFIYFPDIEQSVVNDSKSSSTLLGYVGISNVVSRLVVGYISDKKFVNRLYLYNFCLVMAGIVSCLIPHFDSLTWLRVLAVIYGIGMGAYVSLKSVILVDLLGLKKLTDSFGLLLMLHPIGFLIGAPAVGALFDVYGKFDYGFYFSGSSIFASGAIMFIIPWMIKSRSSSLTETNGKNNEA